LGFRKKKHTTRPELNLYSNPNPQKGEDQFNRDLQVKSLGTLLAREAPSEKEVGKKISAKSERTKESTFHSLKEMTRMCL